jgi:hypothetical protein
MYRRSVFDAVGDFDTSYKAAEDYDLYYRILEHFPVYCHETIVAEIRRHDSNMTHDRTLMLKYNMAALRSQRKRIKGDARYLEAYRAGERLWRDWHGTPVVKQVRAHFREGRWGEGIRGTVALLRYYPQGIPLLIERGAEREKVARRRRYHQRELETREYKLRLLKERGVRRRRNAIKEERRKIQHHKGRIRHLTTKLEMLDRRRGLKGFVHKTRESAKRRLKSFATGQPR